MSEALTAPSALRNRDPILAALRRYLPQRGKVLEIASGSGTHIAHFAAAVPTLDWQPTDRDPDQLRSIEAWRTSHRIPNMLAPRLLDVTQRDWPVDWADTIVCINMIHISPWRATEALMRGSAKILAPSGVLFLYGPYKESGRHTAPSNEAFDADLRARNPEWGVRNFEDVKELGARHGLAYVERVTMPANNLSVIFRRQ